MSHDVFISYSTDDASVASAVCRVLEADGVRCWIAPRNVLPGRHYAAEIVGAIAGSRAMVVVLSESSNTSPQVLREVERAVHHQLPLVPFRIEAVKLSPAFEYYFSSPHWLDALTRPLEPHLRELVNVLRELLQVTPPAQSTVVSVGHQGESPLAPASTRAGAAKSGAFETAVEPADGRAASMQVTDHAAGAVAAAGASAALHDRPGILVLPFVQFSAQSNEEYIGFGLTDEIITSLSGLEGLRVISRTTAAQLKGTEQGVRELGRKLNVRYVLEGSVRRAGDTLRIATRLVSTDSETLVWGKSYEGLLAELFELEKTISRAVVDALSVQVTAKERKRLHEHRISDIRAFEYYLRARQEVYTFTEPALERALEYLKKGAAISGENVALWAAMGYVYWQYINAGISADPIYFQRARECADRILQIDPESPEARRLLGLIEIHAKGDPQVAADHLKAALEANPDDPDALFWLSLIYGMAGRASSGQALAARLLDLDPLTGLHHVVPGFLEVLEGDPDRGLPWLARAHEMEPANPITSIAYGQALVMAGEREQGCRVLSEISQHAPGSFFAGIGLAFAQAVRGCSEETVAALTPDVLENARHDLQYSWTIAQCYAMIGHLDEARDWVENAVRAGFWNYPLLAERDPLLAPLQQDARYKDVMKATKEKWLNFRT